MNPRTQDRLKLLLIFGVIMAVGMYPSYVFFKLSQRAARAGKFETLLNTGRNYYQNGEAARAIAAFQEALTYEPALVDLHLNLANSYLLAGQPAQALAAASDALKLDPKSLAAHYLMGCAYLRLRQFEPALKSLQQAHDIEPDSDVAAIPFQLGRAHQGLQHWEEAAVAFSDAIALEPEHPAAHYALGQIYARLGNPGQATNEMEAHAKILAKRNNQPSDDLSLERCKYTQIHVPVKPEEPLATGVAVTFVDATEAFFGPAAKDYRGPLGIVDTHHDGHSSLFVVDAGGNFRLLLNDGKSFKPAAFNLPGIPGASYTRCLVGDLDHDRNEEVVVLGDQGSKVFTIATNATAITDVTATSGLAGVKARDGGLTDLDFTGKLDLLAVTPDAQGLRIWRNQGNLSFVEITSTSGVPTTVTGARQLVIEDWNNDDLTDVFVTRDTQAPLALFKQRGGLLAETNVAASLPAGAILAVGDLNNDMRADLAAFAAGKLTLISNDLTNRAEIPVTLPSVRGLNLVDYDNDGWLDIAIWGQGIQLLRNLGGLRFTNVTAAVGLDKFATAQIEHFASADFDNDCDPDFVLAVAGQGLKLLRNDGGNANRQLKLRLIGNRSNSSALGMRVEVAAGGLRLARKLNTLPLEIGVGEHTQVDGVSVHWFDLAPPPIIDIPVKCDAPFNVFEPILPNGSCPYLYAWDGDKFQFVTDLLGAAPVGLHISDSRLIDADTEEIVWLGTPSSLRPRNGNFELQITEELREVLYLDAAKILVVDHAPGTEIHSTSKLVPGKPFPHHELVALERQRPLRRAVRSDGLDVTAALTQIDRQYASPVRLRPPQLRGLAEPFDVTMDFGPIESGKPWMLALSGWLRFGGGMANVGASHNPDLPFPFPILEVETREGKWQAVDVVVGAPAGKNKTILVDLAGKLPPECKRLRLHTAFEIHWDRVALFERAEASSMAITDLLPARADLHWRGFSEILDQPWYQPITPDYSKVKQAPPWRIAVSGWCTRYGEVLELLKERDDALAMINGGDELTLRFPAANLPAERPGWQRDLFLFASGWDKDADFHCELGYQIGPLPYHDMNDQLYGKQPRPAMSNDTWIAKYNTRWVGPEILDRVATKPGRTKSQ